jgi:hypothetical protein
MLDAEKALDKVVFFAFDEARQKLEQGAEFEPFTILVEGDQLHIESHPGDDAVECFNSARKAVLAMELLSDAYVFCYDGFVSLDDGTRDAIVVERAEKDADVGEAFALLYDFDEKTSTLNLEETVYMLGEAPSLFFADEFDGDELEEFDDFDDDFVGVLNDFDYDDDDYDDDEDVEGDEDEEDDDDDAEDDEKQEDTAVADTAAEDTATDDTPTPAA